MIKLLKLSLLLGALFLVSCNPSTSSSSISNNEPSSSLSSSLEQESSKEEISTSEEEVFTSKEEVSSKESTSIDEVTSGESTLSSISEEESDGNTYVLNINYGADVTTRNVQSGHLVTFGLGERSDATYTVDTGNAVLKVYGNRRQFVMPTGDIVITIQDVN